MPYQLAARRKPGKASADALEIDRLHVGIDGEGERVASCVEPKGSKRCAGGTLAVGVDDGTVERGVTQRPAEGPRGLETAFEQHGRGKIADRPQIDVRFANGDAVEHQPERIVDVNSTATPQHGHRQAVVGGIFEQPIGLDGEVVEVTGQHRAAGYRSVKREAVDERSDHVEIEVPALEV